MKLDYIETGAPDCPLLLLAGAEPGAVKRLMAVLRRVGPSPVALDGAEGIESTGGPRLLVSEGKADLGVRPTADGDFAWVMDPEGWLQVIDLLAPFADAKEGPVRFQYLCREGAITVVISTDGRW